MDFYRLLRDRRQVRDFLKEEFPDKDLVKKLINQTLDLVPSKQNLVPYSVKVIGPEPENDKYREELFKLSTHTNCFHNKNCYAPYNLIFTTRMAFPISKITRMTFKAGQPFEQFDPVNYKAEHMLKYFGLEVGMFAMILSAFCLQENIDIAYMHCYPGEPSKWDKLPFVGDEVVYLVMSLGYRDRTKVLRGSEEKPEKDEVIEWI